MHISEHKSATRFNTFLHLSGIILLRLMMLSGIVLAMPLAANAQMDHGDHDHGGGHATAKLVEEVREATRQYINVNAAEAAGYGKFLDCVSGPDQGAMGVHYVKNAPLKTGNGPDVREPQALIYEPSEDGAMRLVGVEYIVDAASWLANPKNAGAPVLDGQVFQMVTSPNRYGLPNFFELHVWAWRDSPNGAFVDWNTHVTCENQ